MGHEIFGVWRMDCIAFFPFITISIFISYSAVDFFCQN